MLSDTREAANLDIVSLDYRELYQEELDRRDAIQSATSIPIGLLTVLGSILATILVGNPPLAAAMGWLFLTAYACACYFFFKATYYVARSLHGRIYKLAPSADLLLGHETALLAWHKQYGSTEEAASEFRAYLATMYATAAGANREANLLKSEYSFRATRTILYVGVFAACAAIPYLAVNLGKPPEPTRIVLVTDPTESTGARMTNPKPPTPPPAPATPPPKPVGPPLRDLREGQIPKPNKP